MTQKKHLSLYLYLRKSLFLYLVICIILAPGCKSSENIPQSNTNPDSKTIPHTKTIPGVTNAPFPYGSPEEVGLSPAQIENLAASVYNWVKDNRTVGAEVLVVKDNRIVLHESSGWSDRERDRPLARNSIYRMRSMTKPFIGTSILILNETGQFNLDDTVAQYISSFDNEKSRDITIRQLLFHWAGFIQNNYPPGYWEQGTLRKAVDLIGERGPTHPPGSGFRYADQSSATLGGLVAELTKAPVERFIEDRIFKVIGMIDTFSFFSPDVSWASRMNSTYRKSGDSWFKYWDNTMQQQTPFFRASGGLYSTVFDYARFLTVWMNRGQFSGGRILSETKVVEALQTPEDLLGWKNGSSYKYGYHWGLYAESKGNGQLPVFGHSGSDGTVAIAFPEQKALFLYFTQSRGTDTIQLFTNLALDIMN
jgi:CubicO group peptidase (beta-lactamase class C family)